MKIQHFQKLMKLNIHLLLGSKRHYIDEIEYHPSPICGEKPKFESNITSFQIRQNASLVAYRPSPRLGVLAGKMRKQIFKKYNYNFYISKYNCNSNYN